MKLNIVGLLMAVVLFSTLTRAQTVQDTSTVSIEIKDGGVYKGKVVSEDSDTIRIKTDDFGIISISKNDIVYKNLVSIETVDGNEFLGEIVKEDALSVVLKTRKIGEITIQKSDIKLQKSIKPEQVKEGKLWFTNPQSTRYLWSPNGYGLQKGEGYYQNIWVLWNQFSYGLTNNISVGGGVVPLFLFDGSPTPVFGTLKFSVPVVQNKLNVAGGVIAGAVLGETESVYGIFYGLTTYGTPDNNVSIGLGYGFEGEEWGTAPIVNLSGMFRLGSRAYLLTENYFVPAGGDNVIVLSLGGRWIIKKAALDFGLVVPANVGGFIAFPWLGFTVPFGKVK